MQNRIILLVLLVIPLFSFSQDPDEDYTWWNELHGWEEGDPGWRNWIKMSPAYLGPNALPVPPVKRGMISGSAEIELSASNHFHKGDPTQDISGRLFFPFAKNKIAVELYGVMFEHYAFTEEIRNERFARDKDGSGTAHGDLYFSTLIQILKNRRFPDTMLRFATKTASGDNLAAARYSDTPGYFCDLSFSKKLSGNSSLLILPFWGFGFYSWHTNDELRLQNDACMYSLGTDIEKGDWSFSSALSGYSGYKNEGDRPLQLNFRLLKNFGNQSVKVEYLHGLRDWNYKTARVAFIWNLNNREQTLVF